MKNKILIPYEVFPNIIKNLSYEKILEEKYTIEEYLKETEELFKDSKIKIERPITKTLNYLLKSKLLLKDKNNVLKFSSDFIEYLDKYKYNYDMALQQYYQDLYQEFIDNLEYKDNIVKYNETKELLKTIKEYKTEATANRQASYITKFLNQIVFNNCELDNIINLISKSSNSKKGISTSIKREVFKIILQELSLKYEINDSIVEQLKKIIFRTNLLKNILENNYNNSLDDFFSNILNKPELADKIEYTKIIPEYKFALEIFKDYLDNNKEILLITDTDNDGTMAKAAAEEFKEKLEKTNFNIKYNKIHKTSTVQHGINFIDIDDYLKNKYPNTNPKDINILIMTADNGSGNLEEIKQIKNKYPNVKFIITDHHNPQFKKEDIIKDMIFINWHFLEDKKPLKGYELSGAQTFNLLLQEYLKTDNTLNEEKEKLNLMIENLSQISIVADMVKGYDQRFLGEEIRNIFGQNINKLNSILTLENIIIKINKLEDLRFKELLKDTFKIDNEQILEEFYKKLYEINYIANIIYIIEQLKVLNKFSVSMLEKIFEELIIIKDLDKIKSFKIFYTENTVSIGHYVEKMNKDTNVLPLENILPSQHSSLYELRSVISKYLAKPSVNNKDNFIINLLNNSKLLDNVKNLEKDMKGILKEHLDKLASKYEEEYSKLIVFNENSIISRKLLLKLNPEVNNGIMIILDTISKNEVYGSIRMKDFYFNEVFEFEEDNNKNISILNKEIKQELKKYHLNFRYMGHEKGAAGFKILGINNGIEILKKEYPNKTEKELKDILFNKINNLFNEKYKLLIEQNTKEDLETKIYTEDLKNLPIFMDALNVLKVSNFTHGDNAKISFVLPLKDLPFINKFSTSHQILDEKDLETFPKEYLGTILDFQDNNIIYPKNLVKEGIKKKIKYIETTMLGTNSLIAKNLTNQKPKISVKVKERKNKIIEDYTKLFNKQNNYTLEMSMEDFFNEHYIVKDKKEANNIQNLINKTLTNLNLEEWVVLDIEGIGFGNNNILFNLQVHRFTKDGKVKTTSIFVDPKEIYGEKFKLSPAISKLTGVDDKILSKISIPIEKADKILTDLFKNSNKFILAAHNSPYDLNGIETTLKNFSQILKEKALILDTAPIARDNSFAIDRTERLSKFYIDSNGELLNIGVYLSNHEHGLNLVNFFKNPFNNKTLLAEDEKHKLILKKENNQYFLYYQDLTKNVQPLNLGNIEEYYLTEIHRIMDKKTGKIKEDIKYIAIETGKELTEEEIKTRKNIYQSLQKGASAGNEIDQTNIRARKYSISAMALQEGSETLLEYIENKYNLKDFYIEKDNYKTSILDIDSFYKKLLDNDLIDLSIKSDKDFILYNLEDISTNFYDEDLKDYINNYIIQNDKHLLLIEKLLNKEDLNKIYQEQEGLDDKTFEKKLKTKKFRQQLLEFKMSFIKENLIKNIEQNFIKSNKNNNKFSLKLYENLSFIITNFIIKKYLLIEKYKESTENQQQTILKQLNKLEEEIEMEVKHLIIESFLIDIIENAKIAKYINNNIIKKIMKIYNPNLSLNENIEIVQRKYGNVIPNHIISLIIKSHNDYLEELKKNPKIKEFLEKNNIHTLSEMYEEMHNNASIFDSDTGFEGTLIFKRMLKDKKYNYKILFNMYYYLIKTFFRDLKKEDKTLKLNTFSFNQLINSELLDDKLRTNKLTNYLKVLKEEYKKEGTIPISITNSTNNVYTVHIKYPFNINFDNINEFEKHIPNIKYLEKQVNYLYNINRLLNNGKDLSQNQVNQLSKIAQKIEKNMIKLFGDYYITENKIDSLIKRVDTERDLYKIIKQSFEKNNLEKGLEAAKQLYENISKKAHSQYYLQKENKNIKFKIDNKIIVDKKIIKEQNYLPNTLNAKTLPATYLKTLTNESINIHDILGLLNLENLKQELDYNPETIFS